jgi:hypothetical protein
MKDEQRPPFADQAEGGRQLHGSTDTIAAGLHSHLEAGADHIGIQVLTANGENPMPGYRELARVLV